MYESIKHALLRVLRTPAEPKPPEGSPGSLVVFRSSRKLFRFRLALWGLKQATAVAGFLIFFAVFGYFDEEFVFAQLERIGEDAAGVHDAETREQVRKIQEGFRTVRGYVDLIEILEWIALGYFVVQLPIAYTWLRLEYEMRTYLATDRSLRLREGLWTVREMTLTYPNVQNVTIEQGPLQRVLGIADLVVQTAGGGSGGRTTRERRASKRSMHEGRLHDVDQPERIRELILDHLRRLQDGGLGDAEDRESFVGEAPSTIEAARELLHEARALRASL